MLIYERLDKDLRRDLDRMGLEELRAEYGAGEVTTIYAPPVGRSWKPGDGPPEVGGVDDPAVAQAVGRCVAARVRGPVLQSVGGEAAISRIHPGPCGWEDYPTPVLLQALDHAAWSSRLVDREFEVWWFQDPANAGAQPVEYRRYTKRAGQYDNPAWSRFWSEDVPLREKAIAAARGSA